MENPAAGLLIEKGNDLLNTPFKPIAFTNDPVIDKYLNDLDNYPHFFVLACLMDRQMKAEKAWKIPYLVSIEIGSPIFKAFASLTLEETLAIFKGKNLHRFNNLMPKCFYQAVQRIFHEYNGYPSRIWRDDLSAITIMRRFLQFDGAGVKIASMATNILIREFKLPIKDKSYIDISPDIHVRRVFTRLGFIERNSSNDELIYCARSLYPDYPGVFDLPTWEIGRNWCKPKDPDCNNCYLNTHCRKNTSNEMKQRKIDLPDNMKKKDLDNLKSPSNHYDGATESTLYEIQGIELVESVLDFRNRIKNEMIFTGKRTLSFPGGASENGDNYRFDTSYGILTITVVPDRDIFNRYFHFINLDQPEGIVASDIEINIPKVHGKHTATLLSKKQGHRFICNRGRFTVYMAALKNSVVLNHFASTYGNVEELNEDGKLKPVIRIADLDAEDLFDQIALFTHQMKDFKKEFKK